MTRRYHLIESSSRLSSRLEKIRGILGHVVSRVTQTPPLVKFRGMG